MSTVPFYNQNDKVIERKICWRVTRYCNLRCIHCLAGYGNSLLQDLTEQEKLAAFINVTHAGVTRITWTGGEPTLCTTLPKLLTLCHENAIQSVITTHGLSLSSRFCRYLDVEFDRLRFSFDGLEETHNLVRRGPFFQKTIYAMKKSIALGFVVEANVSVMSVNIPEIPILIDELANIGATKIVLLNLMDRESAHDNKLTRPKADDYLILNKRLENLKEKFPNLDIQINNYWDKTDLYVVLESNGEIFLCSEDSGDQSFGFITEDIGVENLNLALQHQTLFHRRIVN